MDVVSELLTSGTADTVIAEAVGSCTDLQATVVRPLRKYHGDQFSVAPLVTIVDPHRLRGFARAAERGEPESDLSYLFGKQLTEADVIAINKADTIGAEDLAALTSALQAQHPGTRIIRYSALTGDGLADLVQTWEGEASWSEDLDVDYDRYAAAEAQLAWLNQTFDLHAASDAGFSPATWARAALGKLVELAGDPASIGHVKIVVDTTDGMTKMSATGTGTELSVDSSIDTPAQHGTAHVNARVACQPDVMDRALADAVAHADSEASATSVATAGAACFKPGYPRPIHRLAAAEM